MSEIMLTSNPNNGPSTSAEKDNAISSIKMRENGEAASALAAIAACHYLALAAPPRVARALLAALHGGISAAPDGRKMAKYARLLASPRASTGRRRYRKHRSTRNTAPSARCAARLPNALW